MSIITDTLNLISGREGEALAALGITPGRRGAHIHCPLPSHNDRSPSWRWDDRWARYYCTCGHGDILDLVQRMGRASSPMEAAAFARQVLGLPLIHGHREDTPQQRTERERRMEAARAEGERRKAELAEAEAAERARTLDFIRSAWINSRTIQGTPAEAYLRGRGIICPLPDTLSFVEGYGPGRIPAMLAMFGVPGEPLPGTLRIEPRQIAGAHLTFIKPDGSGKAKDRHGRSKIMLGRGHDFPIVLAPPNDGGGLVVAEGIEDALTAHQLTGLGAWAAGAANRLPGIARHVPGYVECVTIIEDDNEAGRRGCQQLAETLAARGIDVLIERSESEVRNAA